MLLLTLEHAGLLMMGVQLYHTETGAFQGPSRVQLLTSHS
jgi:hypothetical protein